MEPLSHFTPLVTFAFLVALIYSSVGHGGASGYLAVLSFYAVPHDLMAASALFLNLLVAGMSFWSFRQAGHFSWKLARPFLLASIPFAFFGGLIKVPASLYALLLAAALSIAALRLLFNMEKNLPPADKEPPLPAALGLGGLIGLVSGMVGVGGGIFLSPILILLGWADPKKTAAVSAFFIFVNSLAGLAGRFTRNNIHITPHLAWMVAAAFLGGVLGSWLGARRFSPLWLRRMLALVLFLAVFKLTRAA